ncbi:hypothetical protein HMPREF1871_01272 [Gemelliphila asaccharolytica]|uniref:Uncharacterized protein n=1 Tax=Gemelliphila asaccharolytica TaxID=502393 RepID=A0ABR5TNQ3_9BACL|nr:hypothetical protein HMPREF1871_01272 [Gemella asaccharolytica]
MINPSTRGVNYFKFFKIYINIYNYKEEKCMKKNLSKSILALSILATPFSYGVNSFAQGEGNTDALREAFSRGGGK